jgi:hypothetical protein
VGGWRCGASSDGKSNWCVDEKQTRGGASAKGIHGDECIVGSGTSLRREDGDLERDSRWEMLAGL